MEGKLKRLISLCKCGVSVDINQHRDYYQSAEESLTEKDQWKCPPEIDDDVRQKMIELDTIIYIHFYPHTPVGFYSMYHYDLDACLDIALSCLDKETK